MHSIPSVRLPCTIMALRSQLREPLRPSVVPLIAQDHDVEVFPGVHTQHEPGPSWWTRTRRLRSIGRETTSWLSSPPTSSPPLRPARRCPLGGDPRPIIVNPGRCPHPAGVGSVTRLPSRVMVWARRTWRGKSWTVAMFTAVGPGVPSGRGVPRCCRDRRRVARPCRGTWEP